MLVCWYNAVEDGTDITRIASATIFIRKLESLLSHWRTGLLVKKGLMARSGQHMEFFKQSQTLMQRPVSGWIKS